MKRSTATATTWQEEDEGEEEEEVGTEEGMEEEEAADRVDAAGEGDVDAAHGVGGDVGQHPGEVPLR